jgi:hypothetical protein
VEAMMPLIIGLVILLIAFIVILYYETRKLQEYSETMAMFIESNSELFGVVNGNAEVLHQAVGRVDEIDKTQNFIKMILDAHAHALRIYGPALDFENSLSEQISKGENFFEEKI